MGFGMIGIFLFWVGLIFLAVWLVRWLFQTNRPHHNEIAQKEYSPRQILEQRYARGEINRQQFQIMLKDLQ